MSLLLDALKKAAKDKEAASAKPADELQTDAARPNQAINNANSEIEFELEDSDIETQKEIHKQNEDTDKTELTLDPSGAPEKNTGPGPNTVSDEALQVLIYKTNREHRRKRNFIWVGAVLASVTVLVVSGMYFFNQMQQEVAALERRHQRNMQVVQAEPVKTARETFATKQPQPEMIVKQSAGSRPAAQKPVQKKPATKKIIPVASAETNTTATRQASGSNVISIARGGKKDPVSALLNSAWSAYNTMDYTQAKTLYEQVLQREKNNRDALMGMGAIALKYGDVNSARHYYNRLLQIDPRDAIANAAIINMNATAIDALSEGKLLTLLRHDPQAAHLHYALGNKYVAQSKWPEAQAAFFSAYENDATNADYAYNLAVSLERIGKPAEAARYYEAAISHAQNSNISFSLDVVKKRLEQLKP
jgi:tetratricopeptide (TPR) repeat protein